MAPAPQGGAAQYLNKCTEWEGASLGSPRQAALSLGKHSALQQVPPPLPGPRENSRVCGDGNSPGTVRGSNPHSNLAVSSCPPQTSVPPREGWSCLLAEGREGVSMVAPCRPARLSGLSPFPYGEPEVREGGKHRAQDGICQDLWSAQPPPGRPPWLEGVSSAELRGPENGVAQAIPPSEDSTSPCS